MTGERTLLREASTGRILILSITPEGTGGRTNPRRHARRLAAVLAAIALTGALGIPHALADDDDDDDEPHASFTFSPSSPLTAQTVTFTSNSVPGEGHITSETWDLDNDGAYDDASGHTASRSFATPGSYTVRLRVRNSRNRTDTTSRTVTVSNRAPTASFDVAPGAPLTLETVSFTSTSTDPDGSISSTKWDLDNDGSYDDGSGSSASRSFPRAGTYTVKLEVRDNRNAKTTTERTVTVGNRPPTGSLQFSPGSPLSGQAVNLTASASDSDGTIESTAWDLDADGSFDDGTGLTASLSFARPGTYTVAVYAVDDLGAGTTVSREINVRNRAPATTVSHSPAAPRAGELVVLDSGASDPDGSITSAAWDLDGDGAYDDAVGTSVSHSFAGAGTYGVAVRVTDDSGASAVDSHTVEVAAAPPRGTGGDAAGGSTVQQQPFDDPGATPPIPPLPPTDPDANPVLQWLQPFPVIRIRGRTTGRGARVDLLSVTAPPGSTVAVRCRGRGCPARRTRADVSATGRRLRLRKFERHLRAGIRLEIFVTKPGVVGKYTLFRIKRIKAPRRVDLCVLPGSRGPSRCPS